MIEKLRMVELQVFITYIVFIGFAEAVTSFVDPGYGLFLHSVALVSLLILSSLKYAENPSSNLFLSLSLAPLIRIIGLSLPLIYFPRYAWYLVAGIPVFVATLTLIRFQRIGFREIGLTFNKPLTQAGIALTGIPFGIVEYFILKPQPLVAGLSFQDLALLVMALAFSTGFVEELVFRGVMQHSAVKALGERGGTTGVTAVFAALHIGWFSVIDVFFVFSIGLFFSFIALKTGSIIGVSLSHGITNILLFLVMPNLISIL